MYGNSQRVDYRNEVDKHVEHPEEIISYDSTKISWTDVFLRDLKKNIEYTNNRCTH